MDWQPIETAPKDRKILLAGNYWRGEENRFSFAHIGMYNPITCRWEAMWAGWFGVRPTHWMPLPDLPTS